MCYVQSAYSIPDLDKRMQETKPLIEINDSFKKIVIVKDIFKPWVDEKGITYISLRDFLLSDNPLDL